MHDCLSSLTVFSAANGDVVLFHTGLCWPAMLDPRAVVRAQVTPHLELKSSVCISHNVCFQRQRVDALQQLPVI